jgi:hypothetical protein
MLMIPTGLEREKTMKRCEAYFDRIEGAFRVLFDYR